MSSTGVVRAARLVVDVNVGWRSGFGAGTFGAGRLEGERKEIG